MSQADTIVVDPATVLQWVTAHKWAPLIALIVGLLVRLVKADTKLPSELPAVFRPYFALFLSFAAADALAVMGGTPWVTVTETALAGFVLAVLGHQTIVEGMRGGVEIPVPGLTRPNMLPSIPSPPLVGVIPTSPPPAFALDAPPTPVDARPSSDPPPPPPSSPPRAA